MLKTIGSNKYCIVLTEDWSKSEAVFLLFSVLTINQILCGPLWYLQLGDIQRYLNATTYWLISVSISVYSD